MDNNQRLKSLCVGLRFNRQDVHKCCRLGGYDASISEADSWLRGAGALKRGAGGAGGTVQRRYRPIPDAAFDAFCWGLKDYLDALEDKATGADSTEQ